MDHLSSKSQFWRTVISCIILPVVFVMTAVGAYYLYDQAETHAAGIDAAKSWARLDPIPRSASRVIVTTRGGLFTREYTVTFWAPLSDVNAWLATSPGTKGVTAQVSGSSRTYVIEPGGGARYAEVKIDEGAKTVKILTYWS